MGSTQKIFAPILETHCQPSWIGVLARRDTDSLGGRSLTPMSNAPALFFLSSLQSTPRDVIQDLATVKAINQDYGSKTCQV